MPNVVCLAFARNSATFCPGADLASRLSCSVGRSVRVLDFGNALSSCCKLVLARTATGQGEPRHHWPNSRWSTASQNTEKPRIEEAAIWAVPGSTNRNPSCLEGNVTRTNGALLLPQRKEAAPLRRQHCGSNALVTERQVRSQSVSIVVKNVRSMDCIL